MSERLTINEITSDQLDALYAELATRVAALTEAADWFDESPFDEHLLQKHDRHMVSRHLRRMAAEAQPATTTTPAEADLIAAALAIEPYTLRTHGDLSLGYRRGWDEARAAFRTALGAEDTTAPAGGEEQR